MEWAKGDYFLTDDKDKMIINDICGLLLNTYWASNRPESKIEQSILNSMCFGLFYKGKQVGFARVVSDKTIFSWLMDFVINEECRGSGLGKWMLSCILEHPDLEDTKFRLTTKDAHKLYEKFGFNRTEIMER